MKKIKETFLKTILFVIVLLVFVSFSVITKAGNIKLNEEKFSINVKENTFNKLHLKTSFGELNYMKVSTNEGNFVEIAIPDNGFSNVEGLPKVPVINKLIEVPQDAKVKVNILSYEVKEYKLKDLGINEMIIPAQPPVSKSTVNTPDFIYNKSVYKTNSFLFNELVKVEIQGTMRSIRLANLTVYPVQYNPSTNTIKVYTNLDFELVFEGANYQKTQELKEKTYSPYCESLYSQVINHSNVESKANLTRYPVKYVIVAAPMFQAALQPFIQWKTKKGFKVIEAYTNNPQVGTTTSSIKLYLKNLFISATTTNPAPSFILFVGDIAQVPAFSGTTGSHVSDLYYCEYSNDKLPEVYYGRFSATTVAELQPQIDKTIEYEKYLMPDPSFLGKVVMIAGQDPSYGPLHGDGQINYGTTQYFNIAHGLTSHTYLYAVSGSSAAAIKNNVKEGVGYANYTAHGGPDGWSNPAFSNSDVTTLTNEHKYPLMIGNCCLTNKFDEPVCFGEALLRASGKGALGYIGCSNSSYWDEDYFWGCGFKTVVAAGPAYSADHLGSYDRLFHTNGESFNNWFVTQGQMVQSGNLAVQESNSTRKDYYWETYHLMGDPSLSVYIGVPSINTTTFVPFIPLGSTTFTLNTAPYSYICLSKDGIIHGTALADSLGHAEVVITPFNVPGNIDLVITCQNKQPYIGTVLVASPNGPYVIYKSNQIVDNTGNNNNNADFGETISYNLTMENVGNISATNVNAVLSTADNYVTILDSTETWSNIDTIAPVVFNNAFSVQINAIVPDQHVVTFTLKMTSDTNTWISTFNITLNAPNIVLGEMSINDNATGNGNGRLDPGESAVLTINLTNSGHCSADNAAGALTSSLSNVLINPSTVSYPTLTPNAHNTAVFNVTIDSSFVIGSTIDFNFAVASGDYQAEKTYLRTVGIIEETFESGSFTTLGWQTTGSALWSIISSGAFEGTKCAKSGTVSDNQNTELKITLNVTSSDTIYFYRKVSSEVNYDKLKFYIDSEEKDSWSGTVAWSQVKYPVTAGNHTFRWEYSKDVSQVAGSDCAWIDKIVFPPIVAPNLPLHINPTASPSSICIGKSSTLYAHATGGSGNYSYTWTPSEGLNSDTIANPIATPTVTTTYSVMVESNTSVQTATVVVTVNPLPTTPAISFNNNLLTSDAANGNQWYKDNVKINGATSSTYTPTLTGNYYVLVTNNNGCISDTSNSIYLDFTNTKNFNNSNNLSIYPNPNNGHFSLSINTLKVTKLNISVINAVNNNVYNEKIDATGNIIKDINLDNLSNGVYMIIVQGDDFNYTRKLFINK